MKENFCLPSGHLVTGVLVKVIRSLADLEKEKIIISADNYVTYFKNYLKINA